MARIFHNAEHMSTDANEQQDVLVARLWARGRSSALLGPMFLTLTFVWLALDLLSKSWAWTFVEEQGRRIPELGDRLLYCVIDGFFYLAKEENTGTIWGLFRDYTWGLTLLRCLMVLCLVFYAMTIARSEKLKSIGLALVLGGALGNLHDNLLPNEAVESAGAVRDFLDFYIPLPWRDGPYHYPTFNIADSGILIGAVSLFITLSREEKLSKKEEPEGEERVRDA